jgi:hypothetical protein
MTTVQHQIDVEDYDSALGKLENDILGRIDKWITDSEAQEDLREMINSLIKCVRNLQ